MMRGMRRVWAVAALVVALCFAHGAAGRRSTLEVKQTCHDRNAKHCDYLVRRNIRRASPCTLVRSITEDRDGVDECLAQVEKMTCNPNDNAVKKTLHLNCGNTCRAEIEMCKDKDAKEAEDEKKAQLVVRHSPHWHWRW